MVGTQTDVTERKTTELTLQREPDIRTLISEFASDFMASTADDFDAAISRALQRSGQYMSADRTYVFLVSEDGERMNNTHEWCAAGIEPEMGGWVIRTALAQMRLWKQQGLEVQVSVNVSSLQLLDDAFVEKLSRDLKCFSDIPPSALLLEVLESSMLNDLEAVSRVIRRSRQMGVSFALDDFGTGYSSLAYLKHLPASVLKIDQSFVREMMERSDDLLIISGVIGMANAFGMQIIAEGVESVEQGSMLLRLSCEQGQGYGIARPMPADEFPG